MYFSFLPKKKLCTSVIVFLKECTSVIYDEKTTKVNSHGNKFDHLVHEGNLLVDLSNFVSFEVRPSLELYESNHLIFSFQIKTIKTITGYHSHVSFCCCLYHSFFYLPKH